MRYLKDNSFYNPIKWFHHRKACAKCVENRSKIAVVVALKVIHLNEFYFRALGTTKLTS